MAAIKQIHKDILLSFRSAIVWGKSVKYSPQMVGLTHELEDEDVLQILKKSNK
jgi:ribosome-interacting GTPase 1